MKNENLLRNIISHYGAAKQADMAIEEMSELTKALLKWRRTADIENISDLYLSSLHSDIAEEIADVQIMLDQLTLIYNVEDAVNEWISKKIKRTLDRMKEENRE